ncbi:hypothetical protein [Celeribacter sp. SCSIO 80788]
MTHFAATVPVRIVPVRIVTVPGMTMSCVLPRHFGHRPVRRSFGGL